MFVKADIRAARIVRRNPRTTIGHGRRIPRREAVALDSKDAGGSSVRIGMRRPKTLQDGRAQEVVNYYTACMITCD